MVAAAEWTRLARVTGISKAFSQAERGKPLSTMSIENNTTLNLSLRLRGGGKVHGSLARAGKVKNQTPKVAKQEDKKKALTGRAKKRWQYNRRFVNVVPGAKKLGPNSNAGK